MDGAAEAPFEPAVSAKAVAGNAAIAAPTPNASARAPTRPTVSPEELVLVVELYCSPDEFVVMYLIVPVRPDRLDGLSAGKPGRGSSGAMW